MPRPMGQACPACGKVFLTNGLQQHLMRCQPGLIKHECTLCKGYFTIAELRHHFDTCPCRPLREYNTSRRSTTSNPAVVQSKTRAGNQVVGAPLSNSRAVDSTGRVRCSHCGRGFAPDRVHVHERACAGGQTSRRGVYNSSAHRLSDIPPAMRGSPRPVGGRGARGSTPATPHSSRGERKGSTWRAEHAAFQAMVRAARTGSSWLPSTPSSSAYGTSPPSLRDDREECPHCSRKFAPSTAERHIPACARTYARPAPPPSLRPSTASAHSSWAPWLTQAGLPVQLASAGPGKPRPASSASTTSGGAPGGSPTSSPYRSYASSRPVHSSLPLSSAGRMPSHSYGRPLTSPVQSPRAVLKAGGGVVASNASSPNNPLATHVLMTAPHPGPARARQGAGHSLVLGER